MVCIGNKNIRYYCINITKKVFSPNIIIDAKTKEVTARIVIILFTYQFLYNRDLHFSIWLSLVSVLRTLD